MDPSVQGDDALLGERISSAIEEQMKIVREAHPDAQFVTDLWQEGARLVQEGYLKIPPEVMTVWADDGYGYIQDKGQVAAGQGTYYHVAMMNNRTNQLTEMVPIERITGELGRFVQAKATNYFLVNTSDIRPYTLTIRAVMDYAWLGHLPGAEDAPAGYYQRYAEEEFGAKAAPAIAAMYKDYFAAPCAMGDPPREYGDQIYHTEGRQIAADVDGGCAAVCDSRAVAEVDDAAADRPGLWPGQGSGGREWLSTTAAREVQQCGEAQPRWDAVWKKAVAAEALVPVARRPFYQASVLTMVTINRESNRMLLDIAKSVEDAQAGKMARPQQEAADAVAAVGAGSAGTGSSRVRQVEELVSRRLADGSVSDAADAGGVCRVSEGSADASCAAHRLEWLGGVLPHHAVRGGSVGGRAVEVGRAERPHPAARAPEWGTRASSARHCVIHLLFDSGDFHGLTMCVGEGCVQGIEVSFFEGLPGCYTCLRSFVHLIEDCNCLRRSRAVAALDHAQVGAESGGCVG